LPVITLADRHLSSPLPGRDGGRMEVILGLGRNQVINRTQGWQTEEGGGGDPEGEHGSDHETTTLYG
jgi:hypothetical protein